MDEKCRLHEKEGGFFTPKDNRNKNEMVDLGEISISMANVLVAHRRLTLSVGGVDGHLARTSSTPIPCYHGYHYPMFHTIVACTYLKPIYYMKIRI